MRGLAGMVVVAATLLAGAPVAVAGTYDVVSCRAPGAGGVNSAWTPLLSALNGSQQPEGFDLIYDCPGAGSQLVARSAARAGQDAFWLHSANHHFAAPAGTAITKLVIWRWGQLVKTDGGMSDWGVLAQTDDGNAPFEGCILGAAYECQFGAIEPSGSLSNASRAEYAVNTADLNWGVNCVPGDNVFRSCPTARQSDGYPLASMVIYGSVVTITDQQAPTVKPAGPLLAAGWRRPSDVLTYDASDSTGIRSARLEIGGRTARAGRPCDYRRPAPCSNVAGGRIAVPAGIADGSLAARIVAEDAAGNPTVVQRTVKLDGTPPTAVLERASGRSIVISLTDASSGVAGATLEVRKNSTEPYRTLAAKVENGRLTAKLDRGRASSIDMRVTVRDAAGNVTQGNPTRLSAASAKVGRRFRRVRSGRVKVPFGRVATLRGRLTLSAGQSFGGQTIVATAAVRRRGAHPTPAGTAVTDRRGRFSLRVPAGPSRTYRLVFNGAGGALGVARGVSVRVPASSTIRATRTRVSGRTRVRFSGRLRNRGQRIPGRGLVLVLQGREQGRWRTFEDTRTNSKGRWHAGYTFSGRPGRYPIRVRIRRQSSYPFELGYSRALTVRVGYRPADASL
jgi:hypothetical protein